MSRGTLTFDGPSDELRQYFKGKDAENDAKMFAHSIRREYKEITIEETRKGTIRKGYVVICKESQTQATR